MYVVVLLLHKFIVPCPHSLIYSGLSLPHVTSLICLDLFIPPLISTTPTLYITSERIHHVVVQPKNHSNPKITTTQKSQQLSVHRNSRDCKIVSKRVKRRSILPEREINSHSRWKLGTRYPPTKVPQALGA